MKWILCIACCFISMCTSAQDVSLDLQKPIRLSEAARAERWSKMPAKEIVAFGTSSTRYTQDIPPASHLSATWKASGWKNEKLRTQIVVASKTPIKNLSVTSGKLSDQKGNTIAAKNISVGFVQYVITDEFRNGCGYRKSTDFDSSEVADMINTQINSVDVAATTTQPVWISVHIPSNVPAGTYTGYLLVSAGKQHKLHVSITVIDRKLPPPNEWSFRLDYWQHPAAIARVHQVPLWSKEHFDWMHKYYTMLANAGQKVITASIVDEPWNHQTYDDYPRLIQWTRKKDGSWKYDYSLFDRYISFVMSCGITERINCYSMVPWKIAFKYYDESLGKDTAFTDEIGTDNYNRFWTSMLKDFTKHLKEKGWFDITTIAMDERPMKQMKAVIQLLKSIDPKWKVSLAGDYHSEIEPDIYDYCVASRWTFPEDVLAKRKKQGKVSTWYTCCTDKYPNEFTFSPPDEAVWVGWYTAATGMDGFLRWAFNSWPQHPLKDSRFTAWPAGDTYQVYPGPLSSIRFEKLIEGIQDFEKIKILLKEYADNRQTQKLSELKSALQTFSINALSGYSAEEMVAKHKHLLN